jgi:PRC-barrel domain
MRVSLGTLLTMTSGSEDTSQASPAGSGGDDEAQPVVHQNVADWHGKTLIDSFGDKIGKLEDVYVDVETDEPMFGTVKEGFIGRHLTFVPLAGASFAPDHLQVAVSKEQVKSAPNIELQGDELSQADESTLYHHYELNYTPPKTQSGRRLARR